MPPPRPVVSSSLRLLLQELVLVEADATSFVMDTLFSAILETVRGPQPYRSAITTCDTFRPSSSKIYFHLLGVRKPRAGSALILFFSRFFCCRLCALP